MNVHPFVCVFDHGRAFLIACLVVAVVVFGAGGVNSCVKMRRRTSAHTETCKRLVKEWSFYVSKAKCLSKVFVSIKGVYFQAEVGDRLP